MTKFQVNQPAATTLQWTCFPESVKNSLTYIKYLQSSYLWNQNHHQSSQMYQPCTLLRLHAGLTQISLTLVTNEFFLLYILSDSLFFWQWHTRSPPNFWEQGDKNGCLPPYPKLKVLQYPRVQLQNLAGNQFSTTLATSCSVEHSAPSALVCQKISEENIDKVRIHL